MKTTVLKALQLAIVCSALCFAAVGNARTIRASDFAKMSDAEITQSFAQSDHEPLTVEFRKGDELPMMVAMKGDFIETTRNKPSFFTVKRTFWVRVQNDDVRVSLDGETFDPIKDVMAGKLTVGAGVPDNGRARLIRVTLDALLR